jgi:hypothetical protein
MQDRFVRPRSSVAGCLSNRTTVPPYHGPILSGRWTLSPRLCPLIPFSRPDPRSTTYILFTGQPKSYPATESIPGPWTLARGEGCVEAGPPVGSTSYPLPLCDHPRPPSPRIWTLGRWTPDKNLRIVGPGIAYKSTVKRSRGPSNLSRNIDEMLSYLN